MSNFFNFPFVILAGVILLPLIPAFILFWALPSSADVSGPFQGLQMKLGGAFAGYFILVVLIFYTKNTIWDPVPSYQVWTVTGTVADTNGGPVGPLGAGDISLLPPSLTTSNSWFTMDVPVKPGQGGATDYPTLAITHPGYTTIDLALDPTSKQPSGVNLTFNSAANNVQIDNLQLQALPPYQPTTPLNAQAAPPGQAGQIRTAGVRQ